MFVAGTTGYDYRTMTLPEDPAEQTRNIFRTMAEVLAEAGSGLDRILRAQYFVTDRAYCEPVLRVCGEVLGEIRPAAGIYVVSGLLKPEMKVRGDRGDRAARMTAPPLVTSPAADIALDRGKPP